VFPFHGVGDVEHHHHAMAAKASKLLQNLQHTIHRVTGLQISSISERCLAGDATTIERIGATYPLPSACFRLLFTGEASAEPRR
jgi:hypothetical protein